MIKTGFSSRKEKIKFLEDEVAQLKKENQRLNEKFREYRMSEPEDLRTFLFKHMRMLQAQECRGAIRDSTGELFVSEILKVAELIKQIDDSNAK